MGNKSSFTLLFFILTLCCFCQHKIKGVVLDSLTKKSVAFPTVSVLNNSNGVIGLEDGSFELSVPDSLNNPIVMVGCVGYYSKLCFCKADEGAIVFLKQKLFALKEIIVNGNPTKLKVGSKKNRAKSSYWFKSGWEFALYMPSTNRQSYVNSIRFYVTKNGVPFSKFRAKIYEAGADSSPGKLLSDTNLILHAKKGNEWVELDISKLKICVPDPGFFVSMQWLPNEMEYEYEYHIYKGNQSEKGIQKLSGQVLGGSYEFEKKKYTWSRYENGTWVQDDWEKVAKEDRLKHPERYKGVELVENKTLNVMIGADLLVY